MAEFFPRESIVWRLEEPSVLRRLTLALVPVALLTGVTLRLYRWVVLGPLRPEGALLLILAVLLGLAFLGAMSAGHLANFTLRSWKWRAPVFGLLVAVAESGVSLALTALGQERVGRATASFSDWLPMTLTNLVSRVIVVSLFALVLAVTVQFVRRGLNAPSSS
jgi:hypothetical protein